MCSNNGIGIKYFHYSGEKFSHKNFNHCLIPSIALIRLIAAETALPGHAFTFMRGIYTVLSQQTFCNRSNMNSVMINRMYVSGPFAICNKISKY